ncbi:MAG: hypothetical protein R2736_11255 [Solirubrobacterales bacterium]
MNRIAPCIVSPNHSENSGTIARSGIILAKVAGQRRHPPQQARPRHDDGQTDAHGHAEHHAARHAHRALIPVL